MTERWVVYTLRDPVAGDVRYVGVTSRPLEKRLAAHICEARVTPKSHRAHWINALADRGIHPLMVAFASVPPAFSWQDLERAVISQFRDECARLVNGTDGGEGVSGRKWSPNAEQRKRMGDAQIGKTATIESRHKRSVSLRARYGSDSLLMEWRKELARRAARSPEGRRAARDRMAALWADPIRAEAMKARMRGSRARKADHEMREILGE
jgi:hypothetical protein